MEGGKVNVFIINIHPENWEACVREHIFGLRKGTRHPAFREGDVFLVRRTGIEYGVTGIWLFSKEEDITDSHKVPWFDAEYTLLLSFAPLVDFQTPVSEEFSGVSKFSEKVQISAMRIVGSVVQLADAEVIRYLELVLTEKSGECSTEVVYQGTRVKVTGVLNRLLTNYQQKERRATPTPKKERRGVISGEPINFRGMVYAPLNEAGVVLLFSKVMDDLGIVYESSPISGFDMVGRMKTEQGFELKHFEFEYRSSNFKTHGHDASMIDYLVCWEDDWADRPERLEVLELRQIIKDLPAQFHVREEAE
jgi:hypothetical protein